MRCKPTSEPRPQSAGRYGSGEAQPAIGVCGAPQVTVRYSQDGDARPQSKLAGGLELREARAGANGSGGLRGRTWQTFLVRGVQKGLKPP